MHNSSRIPTFLTATLVAAALIAAPQLAEAQTEPALSQVVTADEPIAPHGTAVTLTEGHADIGPVIVDNKLQLLLRDDSATPPTWRYLDDVTVQLTDAAQQQVADGYAFTGAKAGDTVWAVPQTEIAGVPWLGWNTQHPSLAGKDATLHFGPHEGAGAFSLFLQNGGFTAPQVIGQDMYVAAGTHAHANWVFTAPGTHTVALSATVGDVTTAPVNLTFELDSSTASASTPSASASVPWWILAIGALVLVAGVILFARSRR
ncbi:choice-of-anchor M domain-containing protein [Corynebacterium pyruviciproducens]